MGCATGVVKFVMFLFNFAFVVSLFFRIIIQNSFLCNEIWKVVVESFLISLIPKKCSHYDSLLFQVGGILMVVAGALVVSGYNTYEHVVNLDAYKAPPIILIVVGSAVFLIAFMGCCGVLRENNCMMMTVRNKMVPSGIFKQNFLW